MNMSQLNTMTTTSYSKTINIITVNAKDILPQRSWHNAGLLFSPFISGDIRASKSSNPFKIQVYVVVHCWTGRIVFKPPICTFGTTNDVSAAPGKYNLRLKW